MSSPADTHAATIYAPNAAGVYLPFAANELVRTDLGLQTVPTRTQLISVAPYALSDANWAVVSATKTAGQVGPANLNASDAGLVTCTASASASFITAPSTTYTSGTTYTISQFVKAGTQSLVQLTGGSAAFGTSQYANFNLTTGAVTASIGLTSSAIERYADGWLRLSITLAATATGASNGGVLFFIASPTDGRGPNVTLTTTFYVGGGDVTAGAFAVPPILTAAATVTGNLPIVSGLSTQLAVGVAGFVQYDEKAANASLNRIIEISDGTTSNLLVSLRSASTTSLVEILVGGVSQGAVAATKPAEPAGITTVAFAFTSNFYSERFVGQAQGAVDAVSTYPTGLDRIGFLNRVAAATQNSYGFIRKVALKFGPQDQASFDAMYAKAVLAAAA